MLIFRSVYLFAGENGILLALFDGDSYGRQEFLNLTNVWGIIFWLTLRHLLVSFSLAKLSLSLVAAHRHITYHDPEVQCSFKH